MKKKINAPKFKNEDQERMYWAKVNLADHYKPSDFEAVAFPNLKPTSHPISLRIPAYILMRIKEQANELDIPYQSLIKKYIAEKVLKQ